MLNKEIAKIDWEKQTADEIHNLVKGLNPIMGAFTYINDKKIKFWKVLVKQENDVNDFIDKEKMEKAKPGDIILADVKKGLYIKAKDGIIQVIEIQGENAKRMNIKDFFRGNRIEVGKIFES